MSARHAGSDALDLGAGLPGWTLRVVIAVLSGAIVVVLMGGGLGGVALVLLAAAALMSVAVPASPAPALVVVLVAMSVVAIGTDPFAFHVLAMIPLVHLLHVACGLAGLLPRGARVHPGALRVPAIRFLVVQTGVFALAGLVALVPTGRSPAVLEFLAIVGVAAIALLVVWWPNRPQ